MRVLLITYSFPPAAGVGVLRAHSLAKYLPENGIHVDVLTTRNAASVGRDASLLSELSSEVQVHRTWTPDLPFGLRKMLKRFVSRGGRASATEVAEGRHHRSRLRTLVGNFLLPDPQVGWLPFAFRRARRIIRQQEIDIVVITVPPFSSVMLASKLRKAFGSLPIVVDFRDEWLTTTLSLVSFNSNEKARMVAQHTEAEAVRAATKVVCVTRAAVRELEKRYPEFSSGKFQCIPNGFDRDIAAPETELSPAAVNSGETVLTYLGTIYGSTDPSTLVDAIHKLAPDVRRKLRLRVVGHIESESMRKKLLSLGDRVELIGFLPQSQAIAYIHETHYLLLITHDPINVSAKLYDYIASGKPILAAVNMEGDARRLLEATNAGWSGDINDEDALCELLTNAVRRTVELNANFRPNTNVIEQFHRRALTQQYATLLRTLHNSPSRTVS